MSLPVISVENLSKRYLIGHRQERDGAYRYTALRDVLAREMRNLARKAVDVVRGQQVVQGDSVEEYWALRNVSFEVQQGDVLGIIGANGAGKSTLLKTLSRIIEPTAGRVTLRGRVASLLEVGTGFHPELTGRENIYLNGAILGMTRAEIRHKFDEIVDFAGVDRFLDTPVKRYSSGMYVRLAFAVAAHLEPEILIIDEVLAVGDAEFQKKCLGKMDEVSRREGRTVLFVSHNMEAVRHLCSSVVLLKLGRVEDRGPAAECISRYVGALSEKAVQHYHDVRSTHGKEWKVEEAWLEQGSREIVTLQRGEPLTVAMVVRGTSVQDIAAECILRDQDLQPLLFCASGAIRAENILKMRPGTFLIKMSMHLPPIAIGRYYLDLILAKSGSRWFDSLEHVIYFDVVDNVAPTWAFRQDYRQGAVTLRPDDVSVQCFDIRDSARLIRHG